VGERRKWGVGIGIGGGIRKWRMEGEWDEKREEEMEDGRGMG